MLFTLDDLADIEDALVNLIQDKKDYCRFEDGTKDQIVRLTALRSMVSTMAAELVRANTNQGN